MLVLMAALCQAGMAVTSPGHRAMGHPGASGIFSWKGGGDDRWKESTGCVCLGRPST